MGAGIATACGHHKDSAPPPPSSLTGSGGTRSSGGSGGKSGSGGTKHGAAGQSGEAGEGGANGGSSAGTHHRGTGGTHGEAGGSEAGGGGVPYSGDMSGGTAGSAGAPGPGDGMGHLFVGPGGYDGGPGTREQPFLTLAGAVSVAAAGDTIVFLDGNYAIPKGADAVTIPNGVSLAADNPRLAAFVGKGGTLLEFAGNSQLDGLRFDGFETAVAAAANDASVSITRASFSNCPSDSGKSALEIGGDTLVTVIDTDDATHDLGDCPALAHVYAHGKLTLDGELLHFDGDAETAALSAEDSATLELSNLNAEDGNLPFLLLRGDSTTTLATSTLKTSASHLIELSGSPSLAVTASELSLDASVTSPDACIVTTNGAGSTLALTAAVVMHGCKGALVGPAPKTLTLANAEIYAMTESGLDLTTGSSSSVTITASLFRNVPRAVRLGSGSPSTFALKVRGTTLGDTVDSGFELDGDATSTWDFGTLADPGNNVLTATTTALDVQSSAITSVTAVGNTWTPSVQAADGSGQYAAPSSPGVLEVTSGSGQNYSDSAGATLRLAESN